MKKKLLLFAMMVTTTAFAQGWETRTEPGDELKGTSERVRYKWTEGETKVFAFYSTGIEWKVGVARNAFKPDPTHLTRNQNPPIYATIGFYDAEGNLLETIKDCELDVKDMYRVAELPVNAKKSNKATKIADYLRTQKGLIRILLPTQFGDGFDMRIPCLNND